MIENLFATLLNGATIYLGVGLLVAVVFLTRWCKSFDPSATHGSWGFRLCIVPGIILLWPVILVKVVAVKRGGSTEEPVVAPIGQETFRRYHRFAFVALAVIGPLLFAVALIWRVPQLEDAPKVEASKLLHIR